MKEAVVMRDTQVIEDAESTTRATAISKPIPKGTAKMPAEGFLELAGLRLWDQYGARKKCCRARYQQELSPQRHGLERTRTETGPIR